MAESAESIDEYVISLRREFHRHPELSMKEFKTAFRVEKELAALGLKTERIGGTGVTAVLAGTAPSHGKKRAVALRADMDALPIQERAAVPFASENAGVMHACGHDAHTASLLGAARLLASQKDSFSGTVTFIFQPGEEFGEGAKPFVEAGVLNGVDRVFGIHLASNVAAGKVAVSAGAVNASVDYFKIKITGRPAHVSVPQLGVDALYVSALVVTQLQGIASRLSDPLKPVLVGVGVLHAGDSYNIVAGHAVLEGTLRTLDAGVRRTALSQIRSIAEQTASLYGAKAEIEIKDFTPVLVNDSTVSEEVKSVAAGLLDPENVVPREPSLGGDNFAEYQQKVPGCYAFVGSRNESVPGTQEPHHSDLFEIDEKSLSVAARLYAAYALSVVK